MQQYSKFVSIGEMPSYAYFITTLHPLTHWTCNPTDINSTKHQDYQ